MNQNRRLTSALLGALVLVAGISGCDGGAGPPPSSRSLTYSTNPALYFVGVAISPNVPMLSGGAVASYSVSPPLPSGLSLDATTGVITGTPAASTPTANYVVTATSSAGGTTANLTITIGLAPRNLTYSTNPAIYLAGVAIAANAPSSGGGSVVSYTVSPALPAGLSLDTTTGVMTGTPTAFTPAADYVVTATNSNGSTSATLIVAVTVAGGGPPSNLSYSANPTTYLEGTAIDPNVPSSSGGEVTYYSVSPALPPGLSLEMASGFISGTPQGGLATADYVVTAHNWEGSSAVHLSITVNAIPPSNLCYSSNPVTYLEGMDIGGNWPYQSGGAVDSYSVLPALPAGLTLNATTGVISGTPTAVAPEANYVVTATNLAGSATVSLSIAVNDAPWSLSYSTNPAVYLAGVAIAANVPSSSGGPVASYTVSPALPAGLSLDPATGIITGTPTTETPDASYVVTATNSDGSFSSTLTITVAVAGGGPPSNLSYAYNPVTYATDGCDSIGLNVPSSSGGEVVYYSVSPALPTGLFLEMRSGVIYGTPTAYQPTADYVVTAYNGEGNTVVHLSITVVTDLCDEGD